MDTIAIRLDPETRSKLEILAKATGVSRSSLVAEGVRRFVEARFAEWVARAGADGAEDGGEGGKPAGERWNVIV